MNETITNQNIVRAIKKDYKKLHLSMQFSISSALKKDINTHRHIITNRYYTLINPIQIIMLIEYKNELSLDEQIKKKNHHRKQKTNKKNEDNVDWKQQQQLKTQ